MSAIDDLATELSRLPGIGRKTALRLTYHLLRQPADQTRRLAQALVTLGERVRPCARCFNLTEDELCAICRDPRRDATMICVVEQASDIGAIERAGEFRGRVPRAGRTAVAARRRRPGRSDGRCAARTAVAADGETEVREVILATNPSLEGEATALYVQGQLVPHAASPSRGSRAGCRWAVTWSTQTA